MGLIEAIGGGPLAIDTAPFIYFVEDHPDFRLVLRDLFAAIDEGRLRAVTSAITLLEVLVVPLRAGDDALAETYESLLTRGRGLTLRELDRPLLRAAARLRAAAGLRAPDALQLAAGLAEGCSAFLTNDRRLPQVRGMRILQLGEYQAL